MQFRKKNLKIKSQKGGNLVEYSLTIGSIAIIALVSLNFLGLSITGKYIASAIELGQCMPAGLIQTICVNGNCNVQVVTVDCADEVVEEEQAI